MTTISSDSILERAAALGLAEELRTALNSRADVNAFDVHGTTPLHRVMTTHYNADLRVPLLLLDLGANINAKDSGKNTPLHLAAALNLAQLSQLLIHRGAVVNIRCAYGNTSLHSALLFEHYDVAEVLLRNDANLNIKNDFGQTPLQLAAEHMAPSYVIQALQQALVEYEQLPAFIEQLYAGFIDCSPFNSGVGRSDWPQTEANANGSSEHGEDNDGKVPNKKDNNNNDNITREEIQESSASTLTVADCPILLYDYYCCRTPGKGHPIISGINAHDDAITTLNKLKTLINNTSDALAFQQLQTLIQHVERLKRLIQRQSEQHAAEKAYWRQREQFRSGRHDTQHFLGNGKFTEVYRTQYRPSDNEVCIQEPEFWSRTYLQYASVPAAVKKIFTRQGCEQGIVLELFRRETYALTQLRHRNIIGLYRMSTQAFI